MHQLAQVPDQVLLHEGCVRSSNLPGIPVCIVCVTTAAASIGAPYHTDAYFYLQIFLHTMSQRCHLLFVSGISPRDKCGRGYG